MTFAKMSCELPKETLDAFEQKVAREKQGELLASLIEKWLDEQARAACVDDIAEGCRYMADVALELEKDFNPLEEEIHRAIEY